MSCFIRKNCWQQDIEKKEYLAAFLQAAAIFAGIVWLFYDSFLPIPAFPVFLAVYYRFWEEACCRKKEAAFCGQFQEGLRALAASLRAGYSAENAFREAARDLEMLYGEKDRILRELRYMVRQLDMNFPLEQVLWEFVRRTPQEDAESFAAVFIAAGKAGGDSIAVIRDAIKILYEKLEVRREIQTLIAAKRLEFRVMTFVPLGIIFYMRLTFREFMGALYGNPTGAAIMSVCLLVYLAAWRLGKKIVEIEV